MKSGAFLVGMILQNFLDESPLFLKILRCQGFKKDHQYLYDFL